LIRRRKRIERQLRGIQAMAEAGAECEKVTRQLSAAQRALSKALFSASWPVRCRFLREKRAGAKMAEERIRHAAALLAKFG